MKVYIEDSYQKSPRNISVASARGCYAKRIISSDECESWKTEFVNSDDLLKDLFIAGHTTTLEHYHITLNLEDISRHFVWRYLHSFPYYSTDQQSQRYVEMQIENFIIPEQLSNDDKIEWRNFYNEIFETYSLFNDKLINLFDSKETIILNKQQEKNKKKKALEFARYILPLGQLTKMKYTINFITMLRLIGFFTSLNEKDECFYEAIEFASKLEDILLNIDDRLVDMIKLAKDEFKNITPLSKNYEIDYKSKFEFLDNKKAKLISHNLNILNLNGINKTHNFKVNPLTQNLNEMEDFVCEHLVSHSCDSQNQRHRTTKGFRPLLDDYYDVLENKYYIPEIFNISNNVIENELKELYINTINKIYSFFDLQRKKYGFGIALYILPNAQKVYFLEKNFMSQFEHKAQKRLCYNAQEEIFYMTKDILNELTINGIDISKYDLLTPCQVNQKYNIKPLCPEGQRFCGEKVWKLNLNQMNRLI